MKTLNFRESTPMRYRTIPGDIFCRRCRRLSGKDMADTERDVRHPLDESGRYAGYDRIMGSISWLLIVLVSLSIKLMEPAERSAMVLAISCLALFAYNVAARYLILRGTSGRGKTFVDLVIFLCFIVEVSRVTGGVDSPFIPLIYLVLMAASLTQGRRTTYFMAGLAVSSYVILSIPGRAGIVATHASLAEYLLHLVSFVLTAHLGAMLSGEAEHARREIEKLSFADEVTGLSNMRNFFHLAGVQEKLAMRYHRPFTICMLDADNLKKINDVHGHLAGTELIRHTARMIVQSVRCTDIVARYGGDEFVVMYVEAGKHDVEAAVQRLIVQMRETPFEYGGKKLTATLSAGIASYPGDGVDVADVMSRADEAMYASKRGGKNMLTVYGAEPENGGPGGEMGGGSLPSGESSGTC